jgi:hypothetical protein
MFERVCRILPRERNTPNVITPKAPSRLRRSQLRMLERRVEPRLMCADMVDVHWKNESGAERQASALLEDISTSGACLNLDSPLPLGADVVIEYRKGRFEGSVCYCFFREIGYYVGVHFEPASKWSPREYRPRHLLDLKRLLTRKAAATLKSDQ